MENNKAQNIQGELIGLTSQILTKCPISLFEEDWIFPYKLGKRNRKYLGIQLNKLDSWHKDLAIKLVMLGNLSNKKANNMELNQFVKENLAKRYIKIEESKRNDYIIRAKNGDNKSRTKVLESSYPYVMMSVAKWIGNGIPLCDLITVGVMGCSRAIDDIDLSKGTAFLTYADWHIKRAIQKEIADNAKTIRIPQGVVADTKKYWRAVNKIGDRTKHKDIEKAAKLLPCQRETIECLPATTSLNAPAFSDIDGVEKIDTIRGQDENTLENIADRELVEKLKKCLSDLESKIITMRFEYKMALREIGKLLNVTRERIRQIESAALKKMRKNYHLMRDKNINTAQIFPNKKHQGYFKKMTVDAL